MRRCFATATNAAQLGVRTTPAILKDIVESRRAVFGDVAGNGRRSGRKWLRGTLRGPAIKAWYGLNFMDVLPNFITAEKEDVFNAEQQLNRVGKTKITGKMKPFSKPLVDQMLFDEGLEEIMDNLDFVDEEELLTGSEIARRDALLAGAEDEETRDAISAMFDRIAADREERRGVWEEKFKAAAAARKESGGGSSKERGKATENLRQGWEDKRSAGDPAPPPPPAAAAAAAAGAPAPAEATGDEAAAAAAAAAAGTAASSEAPDPLIKLAAATVFSVDPSKLTPEQFDAAYDAHCKERAQQEWAALQQIKEDEVLGQLWKDAEALLQQEGLPVSEEGLEKLYLSERAEQGSKAQSTFDSRAKRAAEPARRRISSSSSSSSSSGSSSGGRFGSDRRGSGGGGWGGSRAGGSGDDRRGGSGWRR